VFELHCIMLMCLKTESKLTKSYNRLFRFVNSVASYSQLRKALGLFNTPDESLSPWLKVGVTSSQIVQVEYRAILCISFFTSASKILSSESTRFNSFREETKTQGATQ